MVERLEVDELGLVGTLLSAGPGPRPGVLLLGGSEGSCPVHLAGCLADVGFTCLALRYFNGPGLQRNLVEVPLDYVERAIGWLRARDEVIDAPVGVLGASKGAELALLTTTTYPSAVGAVVAYAPSSVAFAGISFRGDGRRRSSWSLHGTPVPFVPYAPRSRPSVHPRGLALAPMYRAALENTDAVADAVIPVERSTAPILLLSGDRDSMWPSTEMARALVERAQLHGNVDRVEHVRYPEAGHSFAPWAPDIRSVHLRRFVNGARLAGIGMGLELGGRPRANREALVDAWTRSTAFLGRCLGEYRTGARES